jgi:nitroimidazol reductase NimA-like FMN-containing flavoprotein (pyridoxamine 5'-phosphate oxidase superfamily)
MNELRPLSRSECVTLLASVPVGRLVFSEGALPAVRPVNFVVYQGDIIVRTSRHGAIARLNNEVVAFEVDEIDPETRTGWSVVAVGKSEPVTDIDDLVMLSDPVHRPWPSGDRGHFVRVRIELISGRRLAFRDGRGVSAQPAATSSTANRNSL